MRASVIRRVVLALLTAGGFALLAGYAFGASETVSTAPACCAYSKASFTIDAGSVGSFQNTTPGIPHTMTAQQQGPDNKPLFDTGDVSSGQGAAVAGTQYLAPGTYHFFCQIHGPSMSADLVVSPNGTPVARPEVSVKVLSGKLAKVNSAGKLKLKVSAATESHGVSLIASKGAKKLGSVKGLSLAAGASQVVKLKLTRAGRDALDGLSAAKVKVSAAVPFGAPASAKRRLH
jgi:plastocyanin